MFVSAPEFRPFSILSTHSLACFHNLDASLRTVLSFWLILKYWMKNFTRALKSAKNITLVVTFSKSNPFTLPVPDDQDCDISSLEAPTFTTLDRGPPAPMLRLSWDHPVNLIGEKVLSPRIHICDTCNKPILIYGRMVSSFSHILLLHIMWIKEFHITGYFYWNNWCF